MSIVFDALANACAYALDSQGKQEGEARAIFYKATT